MLREVHHAVDVLSWMKTEGATKKPPHGYPDRLPLTAAEVQAFKDAQPETPDAVPLDDLNDWLGWPARPTKEA